MAARSLMFADCFHQAPVVQRADNFIQWISCRGTQQIVSVKYLFGRPLIPYNFLKGIFTSNLRALGNLRPGVFGLIKMSFRVPNKGQLRFSERKYDLRFSGKEQTMT